MLCPLKKSDAIGTQLCAEENCGFYSCESRKCAVASLGDITSEIEELKSALNHTTETLDDMNKRLVMVAAALI